MTCVSIPKNEEIPVSESMMPTSAVTAFVVLLAASLRELDRSQPATQFRNVFLEALDRQMVDFAPGGPDHAPQLWHYLRHFREALEKMGDDPSLHFLVDPPEGPPN